jgi:L-fuculose-phosphate aldolase
MTRVYSEELAREEMAEVCRLMYSRGYISGVEGNCSIRMGESAVLTTPRGTCKGRINKTELVLTDLQGKALKDGQPSTELKMHIAAYQRRADIGAIVHAHPIAAVACSLASIPLDRCILPEVICTLGLVPTAPYATPSTDEVGASISSLVTKHDAIVLDHHGVLCLGKDIWDAFYKLETLEHYAQTVALANLLGEAKPLSNSQVKKLIGLRSFYGSAPLADEAELLTPERCCQDN